MNYDMIAISFLIIILLFSILFIIRNEKVHKFRTYIIDTSYNHMMDYYNDINWSSKDWRVNGKLYEKASFLYRQINDKYEYDEMLYSTKPLKLDKWFTEKEVNFIEFGTLN